MLLSRDEISAEAGVLQMLEDGNSSDVAGDRCSYSSTGIYFKEGLS